MPEVLRNIGDAGSTTPEEGEHGLFVVNELSASRRSPHAWHLPCCQPGNELADRSGRHSTPCGDACWCSTRGDDSPHSCCLSRGACERAGHARQRSERPNAAAPSAVAATVTCTSIGGQRSSCAADTSKGVVLLRSTGRGAMSARKDVGLRPDERLGVGRLQRRVRDRAGRGSEPTTKPRPLVAHSQRRLSALRWRQGSDLFPPLHLRAISESAESGSDSYVDAFGNSKTVQRRQDIQLQKFFAPFSGWFLTPKMRYYLYVWSSNASQGDPAQVVGGGNLSWTFNRFVSVGVGITSLPTVRSTEGQFPYWLGVDDRLIADEFFRGSYTSGVWLKGELNTKVKYQAMFANNLSTLGVSAAQIDNKMDTQSYSVAWLPTTGEFGLWNTFGDYDDHQKIATRLGVHYTPQPRGKAKPAGNRGHREQPDPADRRQRHLHARAVWTRHHRQRGGLPDVERRCAASSTRACRSRASTTGAG